MHWDLLWFLAEGFVLGMACTLVGYWFATRRAVKLDIEFVGPNYPAVDDLDPLERGEHTDVKQ